MRSLLIICIVLICTKTLFAAPVITVNEKTEKLPLGLAVSILEDKKGVFAIEDVARPDMASKFALSRDATPSYGFSKSAFWVKFHLKEEGPSRRRLLECAYPLMEKISLFLPDDSGRYREVRTGYDRPFRERPIRHRHFLFNLPLSASPVTFYMRFQCNDRMEIPLILWDAEAFHREERWNQFGLGVYYGIILVMILYNFLLFFSINSRSYLIYVLFLIAYGLFQMTQNGLAYEFLWPNALFQYNKYIAHSIALVLLTGAAFADSFLQLRRYAPRWHRVFAALQIILLVSMAVHFIVPYAASIITQAVLAIISAGLFLAAGCNSAFSQKFRPAGFYLLAWTALLVGGIIYGLKVLAVLPTNVLTNNAVQLGSAIEIVLLSLGLGDRINLFKMEAFRNKTEKMRLEVEKEQVEIANRNKTRFLASISHELRTPLNSINGIADLLRFGGLDKNPEIAHVLEGLIKELADFRTDRPISHEEEGAFAALASRVRELYDRVADEGSLKAFSFEVLRRERSADLPEPLAARVGAELDQIIKLLAEEDLEIFKAYTYIKDSGAYLLSLIDMILNIARIESGQMPLQKSEISLKALMESSLKDAKNYAASKGKDKKITFQLSADMEAPDRVYTDGQKVKQIVLNFLSNAVKYSGSGQITLRLSCPLPDIWIRIAVSDQGFGIPAAEHHKIFSEFSRISATEKIEGTGLGLALSKKLTDLLGGKIGFESRAGQGSTFWIELPVKEQ